MLIGGVIAFVLDNINGRATRRQRGFISEMDEEQSDMEEPPSVESNGYALPSCVNQFFLKYSWLTYLPVIPSEREIREIGEKRNKHEIIEKIEKA